MSGCAGTPQIAVCPDCGGFKGRRSPALLATGLEGSYIITVKDPQVDAPSGAGLPEEDRPDLSQRLRERFHGRRFIPVDPPDFLDREGAEIVLIGADEDVFAELGVRLDPERETIDTAELFNELRMERTAHPLKPLFEGRWQ